MSNSDVSNAHTLEISNYTNTTYNKPFNISGRFYDPDATSQLGTVIGGGIATNSAITSLVFTTTGGSFTGGTVLIYGVK